MPFSNLLGNELVKAALTRMLQKRQVPNTLLFQGLSGVGKSRFALHFAAALMGELHAARALKESHPDLHVFRPEGKSLIHPVESMRTLIEEVGMPPFEAPVKVFILYDAHKMLPASSNALLKTLEEPNLDSYLILLSDQPELLLPTIISRCRQIPFFPLQEQEVIDFVIKLGKSPEEARKIAFLSHGSLEEAERFVKSTQDEPRALLHQLLAFEPSHDYTFFLKLCTQVEEAYGLKKSDDEDEPTGDAQTLFEEIIAWYRDRTLLFHGISPQFLYHQENTSVLSPPPSLESVFKALEKSMLALQRHVKLRVVLEEFLFQVN